MPLPFPMAFSHWPLGGLGVACLLLSSRPRIEPFAGSRQHSDYPWGVIREPSAKRERYRR